MRKYSVALLVVVLALACLLSGARSEGAADLQPATATPIKHLVVIFGENVSFDHYFATYPNALNPPGEPSFLARPGTPMVNGLSKTMRERNPNFLNVKVNRDDAVNPFRLGRSEAATADQNHDYTAEQEAFHAGLLDSFPRHTGIPGSAAAKSLAASKPQASPQYLHQTKGLVMGYYDGNTVTAYWNYAQRYALNDNSYGSAFGPSTPGAIELISGQTNGVIDHVNAGNTVVEGGDHTLTEVGDGDPIGDVCSTTTGPLLQLSSNNIGEMLSMRGITWGWFEGGFDLTKVNANGTTGCLRSTYSQVTQVLVR
jgi:phospholipase C